MKKKHLIAVLLSAILIMSAVSGSAMAGEMKQADVEVAAKTVPFYLNDLSEPFDETLYFMDGVMDLPYMDLNNWIDIMVTAYSYGFGTEEMGLVMETDDTLAQLTRENGYSALFDFENRTIYFDDFDAFIRSLGDTSLLDMVSMSSQDQGEDYALLQRIQKGSFDRYGKAIEINLADYQIPMYYVADQKLYLVPLQTLGDLFISYPLNLNTFYNGEAVYLTNGKQLGEAYYSAPKEEVSEELALYNYSELCLALDHLYGLKESHDISSFDEIFTETGYQKDLMSTDPNVADGALNDFIHYYLDDLHSQFLVPSYRTEEMVAIGGKGLSSLQDQENGAMYYAARDNADHAIASYEEVGNTAYITFDSFLVNGTPLDYFAGTYLVEEDPASDTLDTVGLVLYAHEQITREDSPIENVVIDLSLNGGGELDAAAVVLSWFLGESSVSVRDSLTGATSTGTYRLDANLDGEFDEADTLGDRKLFCLTSPYSFSCGNLVPNVFKSSHKVTLLGRASGGGSCSVLPMSTALGAGFQISSPSHMSYVKNGSYYDSDTGIEPDVLIVNPDNFYDRTALTAYINQLF